MPTIHDEAICIRQWDWSETSQTVSLFARQTGVFRAVAKGSRREGAPFSGGLELLTRATLTASLKRTGALSTLTSWDLHDPYPAMRRELARFHAGMYIADLIHHALRDDDPHPRLYDACARALAHIGGSLDAPPGDAPIALLEFQWALLVETGRAPALDASPETGRPLERAPSYVFDPASGGLTRDTPANASSGWRVREHTVELLRRLSAHGRVEGSGEAVLRANRLLSAHIAWGLDAPLRTAPLALGGDPQPRPHGGIG